MGDSISGVEFTLYGLVIEKEKRAHFINTYFLANGPRIPPEPFKK